MTKTDKPKPPKMTLDDQHARFVAMAREVQVDESPRAFDRAFERVIQSNPQRKVP